MPVYSRRQGLGSRFFLFDWVNNAAGTAHYETTDEQGVVHRFRYLNGAPLNDANFELAINFLEYWQVQPSGETLHFS